MNKRIFFGKYDSLGKFPDGRVKLDVFFHSSDGDSYVWTPDWQKGTRLFFLEAYRIEKLNEPDSPQIKEFKRVAKQVLHEEDDIEAGINYKLIAIKVGEGVKNITTINEIGRIASSVFDFDISSHPHTNITSGRSQIVYDWIITLSEQPIGERKKLQLLKEFVVALTPESNPLRTILPEFDK
ncbi:MAG: hypothetical protein ABSG90_10215 [Dehalococcoidia bacterium]